MPDVAVQIVQVVQLIKSSALLKVPCLAGGTGGTSGSSTTAATAALVQSNSLCSCISFEAT